MQHLSFIFTQERQGAEVNTSHLTLTHIWQRGYCVCVCTQVCVCETIKQLEEHLKHVSKMLKWHITNIQQRQTTTAVFSHSLRRLCVQTDRLQNSADVSVES